MNTHSYASLEQVRDQLKAEATDIGGDPHVNEARLAATRRIEHILGYKGVPETDSKDLLLSEDLLFDYYSGTLILPQPLLALTSVVDTDGSSLVVWDGTRAGFEAATIVPLPLGEPPYYALQRYASGAPTRWSTSGRLITITGVWGYHPNYAGAWVSTGATLAATMTAGAASFTTSDAVGADAEGYTPRLSPGNLLQIGSEWMTVLTVTDGAPDTVAVQRPVLGTAAAEHASGAAVSVWKPDPLLVRACQRLTAHLYKNRGVFAQFEVNIGGGVLTRLPDDLPLDVAEMLRSLPRYGRRAGVRGI